MRAIEPGDFCENGGCLHAASIIWVGEGGTLAMSRDYMQSKWCRCCALRVQIDYAEKAANRLASLRDELEGVQCEESRAIGEK